MEQLIMRWKNDGKEEPSLQIPKNCRIVDFTKLDGAIDKWLDIVQYGLSDVKKDKEFYHQAMTLYPYYEANKCFFLLENEKAVATITVICNYEKKEGYIHMVACREESRGKGYGTLLSRWASIILKKESMETAYLTTDDWRIPAIKSYLSVGFVPDTSTEEFRERWNKVNEQIGSLLIL